MMNNMGEKQRFCGMEHLDNFEQEDINFSPLNTVRFGIEIDDVNNLLMHILAENFSLKYLVQQAFWTDSE